ncbi:SDR family NAD(P)-dependent oxidoreductase [Pelomonas sp. APW6]|uniref:SDR family NAD(P)-dependent oxidoreductase n=1 Tax=Roseateles subflavus TaxID=3053353 RepID=A0ABT7LHR5_9BURK|nr:SDR family NAD(P)-dependent oxidoreductase [Pelomonas sp. APW6]MDL5032384.1 SDR family NAD(P)-dependent oxidoreductase [Pelomonas sp. APW6]
MAHAPSVSADLRDRHAVVTGGGSGIGLAVARQLLAAGARVTLMGRDGDRLARAAQDLTPHGLERLQCQACDVGDEASVQAAFARAVEGLGAVDILVNNAGQVETAPLTRTSLAQFQQMLQVNLTGTFLCSREVLPGMLAARQGRIINVASTAALKGYAYVAAYCAAKHGVLGLTRAMAAEVARKGVTVNAVCPGYTETEIVQRAIETITAKTGRSADEARAELAAANPQGRLIQPEEVALQVLMLASPLAAGINGQALAIDGGECVT